MSKRSREKCQRSPSQYNKTQCELTPGYCWVVGRGCVRVENAPPGSALQPAAASCAVVAACTPQPQLISPLLPYSAPPLPSTAVAVKPSPLFQPPVVKTVYRIGLDTNDFTQNKEVTQEKYNAYYWLPEFRSIETNAGLNLQQKQLTDLQRLLVDVRGKIQSSAAFYRNFENASKEQNNGTLLLPRYKFEHNIVVLRWILLYYFRFLKSDASHADGLRTMIRDGLRDAFHMFTTTDAPLTAQKLFDPVSPTTSSSQQYAVYNFVTNDAQQLSKAEYYTLFNLKNYSTGAFYIKALDKMYGANFKRVKGNAMLYTFKDAYEVFLQALVAEKNKLDRKEVTPSVYLTRAHILMHLMYVRLKVPYVSSKMKSSYDARPPTKEAAEYETMLKGQLRAEYIEPVALEVEKSKAKERARVPPTRTDRGLPVAPVAPGGESALDAVAALEEGANVYSLVPKGFQSEYPNPNFDLHNINIPFRMIIAGPSGTGKTTFFFKLLTKFQHGTPTFASVWIVVADKSQALYRWLESSGVPNIHIVESIESTPDLESFDRTQAHLVVWDDLALTERKYLKVVDEYYIAARHRGVSMMFLTQYLFKVPPVVRTNTSIFVLFSPLRDAEANELLQVLGFSATPENRANLGKIFEEANTLMPSTGDASKQRLRYPLLVFVTPGERDKMFRQNLLNFLSADKYFGKEEDEKAKSETDKVKLQTAQERLETAKITRQKAEKSLDEQRETYGRAKQMYELRYDTAKIRKEAADASAKAAAKARDRQKELHDLRVEKAAFDKQARESKLDQRDELASFTLAMKIAAAEQQDAVFKRREAMASVARQIADKRLAITETSDTRQKEALTRQREALVEQRRRNMERQKRDVLAMFKDQLSVLDKLDRRMELVRRINARIEEERKKAGHLDEVRKLELEQKRAVDARRAYIQQTLLDVRLYKENVRLLEQERAASAKEQRQQWIDAVKAGREQRQELRTIEREQRGESRKQREEDAKQREREDRRLQREQKEAQKKLKEEIQEEKKLMSERMQMLEKSVTAIEKTLSDYRKLDKESEFVERGALIAVASAQLQTAGIVYQELADYAFDGGSENVEIDQVVDVVEMDVDDELEDLMDIEGGSRRRWRLKGGRESELRRALRVDMADKTIKLNSILHKLQDFKAEIESFYRQEQNAQRPMDLDDDIPADFKVRERELTDKERREKAQAQKAESAAKAEADRADAARIAKETAEQRKATGKRTGEARAKTAETREEAARTAAAQRRQTGQARTTAAQAQAATAEAQAAAAQARAEGAKSTTQAAAARAEGAKFAAEAAEARAEAAQIAVETAEANLKTAKQRQQTAKTRRKQTKSAVTKANLTTKITTLSTEIADAEAELARVKAEAQAASQAAAQAASQAAAPRFVQVKEEPGGVKVEVKQELGGGWRTKWWS